MKSRKSAFISALILLVTLFFRFFPITPIETRTWVLTSAQQSDGAHFVVAHKPGLDLSSDDHSIFAFSKEVELTCVAKGGKLTITDKTNDKIYEGTYKANYGRWKLFAKNYTVVIDGKEGVANISSGYRRTLFISVGDHYLDFEAQ